MSTRERDWQTTRENARRSVVRDVLTDASKKAIFAEARRYYMRQAVLSILSGALTLGVYWWQRRKERARGR